jgi:hypothetical protein
MSETNYKLYWFTFANGWNPDGTPIIITRPRKGVSIGHAESNLRREYTHAFLVGQATKEDIDRYKQANAHIIKEYHSEAII